MAGPLGGALIIAGARSGPLVRMAGLLEKVLSPRSGTAGLSTVWWEPELLAGAPADPDEAAAMQAQMVRALASAPVFVVDLGLGPERAGYLLGAREALATGATFATYGGAAPPWTLAAFAPRFIDAAGVSEAELAEAVTTLLPGRAGARWSNAFRSSGAVTVRIEPELLGVDGLAPARRAGQPQRPSTPRRGKSRTGAVLENWRLKQSPKAPIVGVACGDIRQIVGFPVWINSENVDMQMPRIVEKSVSAHVRWLGAKWSGPNGEETDDAIYVDLAREMGARPRVPLGEALITRVRRPTALYRDHGVRLVAHVAVVEPAGEAGDGYRATADLGRSIHATLDKVARYLRLNPGVTPLLSPEQTTNLCRAVLTPILGAGDGGVATPIAASQLVHGLGAWSEAYAARVNADGGSDAGEPVQRVYVLCRDSASRDSVRSALQAQGFGPSDPPTEEAERWT